MEQIWQSNYAADFVRSFAEIWVGKFKHRSYLDNYAVLRARSCVIRKYPKFWLCFMGGSFYKVEGVPDSGYLGCRGVWKFVEDSWLLPSDGAFVACSVSELEWDNEKVSHDCQQWFL